MTEPEIIKLRKEVFHLKQQNKELKEELEEKTLYIGQLESEHSNMKNEHLLISRTKLSQQKDLIKLNVQKALEDDKKKMINLEKANADMLNNIKVLELNLKGLEIDKQKLQKENTELSTNLKDIAQKNNVEELVLDVQAYQRLAKQKESEYQKVILQWNELVEKMENVMSENAILREWANVPQNLGLPIEQIKIGEKKNIEYFKAALRRAEDEIRELEEERARLKNKLFILDTYHNSGETPFSVLTKEQQQDICEYAIALHEGRKHIMPHQYELFKENDKLRIKIEVLEKQLESIKIEGSGITYNKKNVYKNNDIAKNNRYLSTEGEENKKMIEDLTNNFRYEMDQMKSMFKDIANNNMNNNISGGFNKFSSSFNNVNRKISNDGSNILYNNNIEGNLEPNFAIYNQLQIPPIALIDRNDIDNTNYAYSYRFGNRYRIDINQLNSLFGLAPSDGNTEQLKIESASLMTQLIESIEVNTRMKIQDYRLNSSLEGFNNRIESLVLKQNSIFDKFVIIKKEYTNKENDLIKVNISLKDTLEKNSIRNKALEECIKIIESKDLSTIEKRVLSKIQENAVLELKLLQLNRKYNALYEDNKRLKLYVEECDKFNIEKDSEYSKSIIKLKEWKSMLGYYVRLLTKKIKNSVSKNEYDRISIENRYMRERQHEMVIRDIENTKKASINDSLKLKLRELESDLFSEQELRIDSEIELNFIKKRLQEVDPLYNLQENIFKKLVCFLSHSRISLADIEKVFDPSSKGLLSINEFKDNIKNLFVEETNNINERINSSDYNKHQFSYNNANNFMLNDKEIDVLSIYADTNDNKEIDISNFIRKINRSNILNIKNLEDNENEEVILSKFIEKVKQLNMSLEDLFESFDINGDGTISKDEFVFLLERLDISVSNTDIIDNIIRLVCGQSYDSLVLANINKNNEICINYSKFCDLFDEKSRKHYLNKKKNLIIKNSLKIDNKINIMCSIIDKLKKISITSEDIIYSLFNDKKKELISDNDFKEYLNNLYVNYKVDDINLLFKELNKLSDIYNPNNNKDNTNKTIDKKLIYVTYEEFLFLIRECENKILLFNRLTNNDKQLEICEDYDYYNNEQELQINTFGNSNNNNNSTNYLKSSHNLFKFNGTNEQISDNKKYPMIINTKNLDNKSQKSGNTMYNRVENKAKIKIDRLIEQEKFLNFKLKQLKKQYDSLYKINQENEVFLEDYSLKNSELNKKCSDLSEELSKLKIEFSLNISREDYKQIETKNEILERETNILRIGLNTFKDLYSSASKQIENITILSEKKKDELETYELALKEIQSESDPKALIGKLYYSLLVSRWRESKTLNKYDDMINDMIKIKETSFKNESECKKNYSQIIELETMMYDKIEENIKLSDELNTQLNPIITPVQLDELKNLVKDISKEKSKIYNLYFDTQQKYIKCANENNEMKYQIEYSNYLVQKIKYDNKYYSKNTDIYKNNDNNSITREEYLTKTVIELSEDLKKLKISSSANNRENKLLKETEKHLKSILNNNEKEINKLESDNNNWDVKYRKMEQHWANRDKERQNKFFDQIKNYKEDVKNTVNNNKLDINDKNSNTTFLVKELQEKVFILEEALNKKNDELKKAFENNSLIKEQLSSNMYNPNNILSYDKKKDIEEEETRQLAATSHAAITTLNKIIDSKNSEIQMLQKMNDNLNNDNLKIKSNHIKEVSDLQHQLDGLHNTALDKLTEFINNDDKNNSQKILLNISKNKLSSMTLADIEMLIDEKDKLIKRLVLELKSIKEENELNYLKIKELNSEKINNFKNNNDKFLDNINNEKNNQIESLKNELKDKIKEIDDLKSKVQVITTTFTKRLDDKQFLLDEDFMKLLNKTSEKIPDRLSNQEEVNSLRHKIQQQRNQITKLNNNLKTNEENNKKNNEDLRKKLVATQNTMKIMNDSAVKDTNTISKLNKEKNSLKEKIQNLNKEIDKLKSTIQTMQSNNDIYSRINYKNKQKQVVLSKDEHVSKIVDKNFSTPNNYNIQNINNNASPKIKINESINNKKEKTSEKKYNNKSSIKSEILDPFNKNSCVTINANNNKLNENTNTNIDNLEKSKSLIDESLLKVSDDDDYGFDKISESNNSKKSLKNKAIENNFKDVSKDYNINDDKMNNYNNDKMESKLTKTSINNNNNNNNLSITNNLQIDTTKQKQDELLKKLVEFCIKKNKNMNRHLKRYCKTLGKLSKQEFVQAIDELKIGFIENEITILSNICSENDYISVKKFVNNMILCNKNYENIAREPGKIYNI